MQALLGFLLKAGVAFFEETRVIILSIVLSKWLVKTGRVSVIYFLHISISLAKQHQI